MIEFLYTITVALGLVLASIVCVWLIIAMVIVTCQAVYDSWYEWSNMRRWK